MASGSASDTGWVSIVSLVREISRKETRYNVPKFFKILTAWSRFLLERLTGFEANQEIPRILWNPKFITALTNARHPSLS